MKKILLSLFALLAVMGASAADVRDRIAIPDGSPNGSELTKEVLESDAEGNTLSAKYTITNGTWGNNASHLSIFKFAPLSSEVIGDYEKIVVEFDQTIPTSNGDPTYGFIPLGLVSPVKWTKLSGLDKWVYTFTDNDRANGIEDFSVFFNASGDLKDIEFTITGIYLEGSVGSTPEPEPEEWVCPEGEVDITTLPWVKNDQDCITDFGKDKGNIFGTDSGEGNISYVDVTNYSTIKVYGKAGSIVRAFFNRNEAAADSKTFIFVFDAIGEDGVATFDISKVVEAQGDYGHIYLNGIKAGPQYNSVATVYGITLIEKAEPIVYTRETEEGKIGTIALDYSATIEGATLYEVVGFDAESGLYLAEVEGNMVGGTPYIYVATADEITCTQTGATTVEHGDFNCTKGEVGNGLVGCYEKVTPSTGWFGFIRENGYVLVDNKLHNIAQGEVTIPANCCFFDSDKCKSNNIPADVKMQIGLDKEATAITNVNAALENGKIYDLNGREVKSMKKGGIYVVGGMKVSVK